MDGCDISNQLTGGFLHRPPPPRPQQDRATRKSGFLRLKLSRISGTFLEVFFKQIWSRRLLLLYTNLSSTASPCYFTINVNCGPFMYCIPLKGFFALKATCLLRVHNSSLSIQVARNKWPKFDEAVVFGLCLNRFFTMCLCLYAMHCDTDQKTEKVNIGCDQLQCRAKKQFRL